MAPYWRETALPFAGATTAPPQGRYDVLVIGGGFTGLAAARRLAMAGRRVALFEAGAVCSGASGRNGGHLNNGLAHSFLHAAKVFGRARAIAMHRAFDSGIDAIERIAAEEDFECDFRRAGKLKLASKPGHVAALAANCAAIAEAVDPAVRMLSAEAVREEVGSRVFHGAMLQPSSAMMHMGRFAAGLAGAAARRGAEIREHCAVERLERRQGRWVARTPLGEAEADAAFLATGAETPAAFGWHRRRIVPVGSFVLATRPLTPAEARSVMPADRTCVTSLNIGAYFRLSPDRRLIFGGRARFTASADAASDARSGAILRRAMLGIFPQLADVAVDYCWGGLVDMTQDRFPRVAHTDGLWCAMGYSGHGAQLSPLMGEMVADRLMGRDPQNPFEGLPWPPVPGHTGKAWFLPLVGLWYGLKDRLG